MSPEDLTKDVITMNEGHLSENILDQILHNMPTMDELSRLIEMAKQTPIDEFHSAEKFAITVKNFFYFFVSINFIIFFY